MLDNLTDQTTGGAIGALGDYYQYPSSLLFNRARSLPAIHILLKNHNLAHDLFTVAFKGKKIMVVNTASKCGFTPQYMDLQELHQQHPDDLVIVGFPANNYGAQEPGTNTQIAEFCQQNYIFVSIC